MTACPICSTGTDAKYKDSPYWVCPNCACWFQDPMPPKTYIADFEGDPTVMSDGDREVNRQLADYLFREVMHGKPGPTLDIGAKLPVLAARLAELDCEAHALDAGAPIKLDGVYVHSRDFEAGEWEHSPDTFRLVTLIHTFEHLYDPLAGLRRCRACLDDSGRLFIRLPMHDVPGFERDLTPGHYSIHPFYHCLSSVLEALVQTKDTFVLESFAPMAGSGQADLVLRPL
jgi:hypothetical protein